MLVDHELNSLLQKIEQRNQAALGEFYDHTVRYVYGLAMRITADTHLSERITQNVYLHVWHNTSDIKNIDLTPVEWLIDIARHQIMLDCSFENQHSHIRTKKNTHHDRYSPHF